MAAFRTSAGRAGAFASRAGAEAAILMGGGEPTRFSPGTAERTDSRFDVNPPGVVHHDGRSVAGQRGKLINERPVRDEDRDEVGSLHGFGQRPC